MHLNIRTLLPNFEEIKHIVSDLDIDILSLNETRLDNSISDGYINIDSYCLERIEIVLVEALHYTSKPPCHQFSLPLNLNQNVFGYMLKLNIYV